MMSTHTKKIWGFLTAVVAMTWILVLISCSGVRVVIEIPDISQGDVLNEYVTFSTLNATPSEHTSEENPILVDDHEPFDFQIKNSDGVQYTVTFRGENLPPETQTGEHIAFSIDLTKTASGTYVIEITASQQVHSRSKQRNEAQAQIWLQVQNQPPDTPVNIEPQNGALNQPVTDLHFAWESVADPDDSDDVFYHFYLGTSQNEMVLQASPTQNAYTLTGPLEYETQYFWQIVADDGKENQNRESTGGEIWHFTTQRNIPKVTLSVQSQPQIGGDVKIGDGDWLKEASLEINEGSTCTIHARASTDYLFDGWYVAGVLITHESSYEIMVTNDTVYQASFVEIGDFQPPEMVYVAKTSFQRDAQTVTLTYGYRISKTEVTINQYHAFQNVTQISQNAREANRPVVMVDWHEAVAFCNWLSSQEGLAPAYDAAGNLLDAGGLITQDVKTVEGYRLPTEAEWELAARGGGWPNGDYLYAGSDTVSEVAWYAANSNTDGTGPRAQSVAGLLANDLGLHDMSGNVREWCHDWHGDYPQSHLEDPIGPVAGHQRIARGGGWDTTADTCLVGARDQELPYEKAGNLGFRVAKTEMPAEGELIIRWKEEYPPAPPHRPPIEGENTVEEIVANKPIASLVVTVNEEETIIEEPQHVEETQAGEHVYAAPVENLQQDEDNPVKVVAKNEEEQPSNEIQRNFPWKPIVTSVQVEVGECEANQCVAIVRFESNQEISQIVYQIGGSEEQYTINDPFGFPDENGIYGYSFSVTVDAGEFTIYFSAYGVNGQDTESVSGFCDCNIPPKLDEEDYTVEVDECVDNECQVTIGFWVDQLLTHISIQTDGGDPQQQEAGNPASVLNRHRYEIVTSVGPGEHTITVRGINAKGTSNPLTVTVDCNCVIPTPDPAVISDLDYFVHECENNECMVSVIFTSNQPIDKVQTQVDDNERVDYENLDSLPDQPEGEYRYQFFMSVTPGEHTIWFEALNDNGRSNTLSFTVDCVCVIPTPDPPVISDHDVYTHGCVQGECMVSIIFTSDQELDAARAQIDDSDPSDYNDLAPIPDQPWEYRYQFFIPVTAGEHTITFSGVNANGISNSITVTVECVCETPTPPTIAFDPEQPLDDTTTEETAILHITSDQELDTLKVTNNGQEQVINNPEGEKVGDEYKYQAEVPLEEGDNHIIVEGENENGPSEGIYENIERGRVPDFSFNPTPPTQVDNCVEGVCTYVIKIKDNTGEQNEDWKLTDIDVSVGEGEFVEVEMEQDEQGNYLIPVTLQEGDNAITIAAYNRFGMESLSCNIECVCPKDPPTIAFNPEPPATSVADEIQVSITSDQILEILTIWNNTQPQVIESPVYEQAGDAYTYNEPVALQTGFNELIVQGENVNGLSNPLQHFVEQGIAPQLIFNPDPPFQVYNCVNSECTYVLKIRDLTSETHESMPLTSLTYSVDSGEQTPCNLEKDEEGNYTISLSLLEGSNSITIWAQNRFGSSFIGCTIECICECPPAGYTLEHHIGETDISKPIGIDFQPDFAKQRNYLNVLTKTAADETKLQQGELKSGPTFGKFLDRFPTKQLPSDPLGYAHNGDMGKELIFQPQQIHELNDQGDTCGITTFPPGHTAQPGQISYKDMKTSYITKDEQGSSQLNQNHPTVGNQQFPFGTVVVGLGNMSEAFNNQKLYGKTALCALNVNTSGSRDTGQYVFTLDPQTGATDTLFEIATSHGTVIDIIPDTQADGETVHFIVTTVKNETEYWVNIYDQAGERLHAFKSHDLSDLEETSGATIFYKVIMATYWPDGKLYIIHSEFPGVQIWTPEE